MEHGVLYARDKESIDEDSFVYTDGSDGIFKYTSTDKSLQSFVAASVKVPDDAAVISIRGYMLIRDTSTGEEKYYYTELKSGSYNSINQQ